MKPQSMSEHINVGLLVIKVKVKSESNKNFKKSTIIERLKINNRFFVLQIALVYL